VIIRETSPSGTRTSGFEQQGNRANSGSGVSHWVNYLRPVRDTETSPRKRWLDRGCSSGSTSAVEISSLLVEGSLWRERTLSWWEMTCMGAEEETVGDQVLSLEVQGS
jgi:hypothetical protein